MCALVLITPVSLYAQHQTFLGVELGGNPELFRYDMKKKGFYESQKENYDCLYGKFLGVDCRLWIHEKNHVVQKLVINYRYEENMSFERAKSLAEGVAMIICKELQEKNIKYFLTVTDSKLGPYVDSPTIIHLENGYYQIHFDGSMSNFEQGWSVFVSLFDFPEEVVYSIMLQREKEQHHK